MNLHETGFLRLRQILGDPKTNPPTPAIIPVSKSTWWKGVQDGRYPRPVKLSKRCSAWRTSDIENLVEEIGGVPC